ncbi:MAG TPA: 3-methyl-2-oxobutanoate hydroxymethyltransferase [Alphaproteobacteria bacterium]|nr:3-methyl-2-oxobutanoate hydroxymethyltransferase [Alphaproteobacteria bacterium]
MQTTSKITANDIRAMKSRGERIAALTAYDFPMTKLLDEAGIPFLLVGDSLGMVVLGYPDTTHVTLADVEHHVRAAARAKPNALLGADLPFKSYETVGEATTNARRLAAAGAEYVKLEGGREMLPQIRAILSDGIPVCGHLGMLPQSVREEGGYHVKGKKEDEHRKLVEDAGLLADAGVFAVVLELVTPPVAKEISGKIAVPTIGIGSGDGCDGEILVTYDLVGMFPWFRPRFVRPLADWATMMKSAIAKWKKTVQTEEKEK